MADRPQLTRDIPIVDFRDFYWYKEELQAFCRQERLSTTGGKIVLAQRIEEYLRTGERSEVNIKVKPTSKFDWHSEELTLDTVITDNYKNSENVRSFFAEHIGNHFKFNVAFMNWMKSATGKTLREAIEKWLEIREQKKNTTTPKEIAPQFEYNTYIRDFLQENTDLTKSDAITCWKKKKLERGDNTYAENDLSFLKGFSK